MQNKHLDPELMAKRSLPSSSSVGWLTAGSCGVFHPSRLFHCLAAPQQRLMGTAVTPVPERCFWGCTKSNSSGRTKPLRSAQR